MAENITSAPEADTGVDDVRRSIEQLRGEQPIERGGPGEADVSVREHSERIQRDIESREPEQVARRNERGRFRRSSLDAQGAEPAQVQAEQPVAAATEQSVDRAPDSWRQEHKQRWGELPAWAREEINKREADVSRGFQQWGERGRQWQELESILAPRRSTYQQFGFQNDVQAVNHLLTISDAVERDPAGTLAFLIRHYRVDPGALFQRLQGQPVQQQQFVQQQPMTEEQRGWLNAQQQLAAFEAQAPADYERHKPRMAELLWKGEVSTLADAYATAKQEQAIKPYQDRAALERKRRASNASVHGAPYGNPAPRKSQASVGSFNEVADDVREAIGQLS
jgi:hypothetical protein